MEEISQPQVPQTLDTSAGPKKSKAFVIGLGIIGLLVVSLIMYFIFMHRVTGRGKLTEMVGQKVSKPSSTPIPTVTPVTSQNVNQVLQSTNNSLDQSINQANTDLKEINAINSSQDSTNNL